MLFHIQWFKTCPEKLFQKIVAFLVVVSASRRLDLRWGSDIKTWLAADTSAFTVAAAGLPDKSEKLKVMTSRT